MLASLKKVAALCVPTLVFLGIAEVAARFTSQPEEYPLQPDPVLNHVWKPGSVRTISTFANRGVPPYTRRVNGQSWLADSEISPEKPQGVYRIAYLGDSFVEGTCPHEDTVPAYIERTLTVPGKRVEGINTGTMSYSPTLHYLLLKTKLRAFSPDLVVINVDMTDVFDDSIYRATLKVDPTGDPVACEPGHPALTTHRRTDRGLEKLTPMQRIVLMLSHQSALVRLGLDVAHSLSNPTKQSNDQPPPAFAWCGARRTAQTTNDVAWTMAMLARTISLAKQQGSRVVVTAVPHLQQLTGAWSLRPMSDIAAVCAAEQVPFLDPIPAFRQKLGTTPPADIYIPNDMHFNPKGYQMWGEIQREFLASLNLS